MKNKNFSRKNEKLDALSISGFDIIEDHYRAIVENSDDAIISKNLEGAITSWNLGAEKLFGYTAAEMIGQPMLRLLPKERENEEIYILNRILAGEKIHHFESVRIHKNGQPVPISATISPIRDSRGRIIGASKIARDISEKMRLESMSRHLESVIRSSDDAIIGKRLDGIIESWNPGAQVIFGYAPDEMIGNSIRKLFPPEIAEEEDAILLKIKAGEKVDHFKTTRLHKDGRRIDVSVTISPIRDQYGNIVGASKIARDISAEKKAESRLRLISKVFTDTAEAVMIVDASFTIIEVNSAFSRISGYRREEVIGNNPRMFMSSRQGPEYFVNMREALLRTGHFQGEVWSRRKNGEAYAGLLTASTVLDDAGSIEYYIGLMTDITPLRLEQERLEHLANFDALTNLPNRALFADRLQQAILASQRRQQPIAVLYLDFDGFKRINDSYGHEVGDKFLMAISNCVNQSMRNGDTLARIGGDEFAAVLLDIRDPYDCGNLVERILQACSEPVQIEGRILQVSASIGVALYPQDAADAEQLLRHADRAMYAAKQSGKNRYHLFASHLDDTLKAGHSRIGLIHKAIEGGEVALWCRPKVNMRTGTAVGMEALMHWPHSAEEAQAPADFLPAFGNNRQVQFLENWMLEKAFRQLDDWSGSELGQLSLSINVSRRRLQKASFAIEVAALLKKYPRVDPRNVEIEIRESDAPDDLAAVAHVMRECLALGIRFTIGGFGAGNSSLSYLRQLPAETLKIDRVSVRRMLSTREDSANMQALLGLTAAFERNAIAEGVETAEIGKALLDMHCELALGPAIANPMPAHQVDAWVRSWRPPPTWRR